MTVRPATAVPAQIDPALLAPKAPATASKTSTAAGPAEFGDTFEAAAPNAVAAVPAEAVANPGQYMHNLLMGNVPFPADFSKVMGYQPIRVQTEWGVRMQNPHGSVSSPGGIGPTQEFDPCAKTHDLGYDILRYYGRTGHPLGPDARKTADAQFREDCFHEANDLHSGLDKWRARSWAQIYSTAVELNSRRQNYGVP